MGVPSEKSRLWIFLFFTLGGAARPFRHTRMRPFRAVSFKQNFRALIIEEAAWRGVRCLGEGALIAKTAVLSSPPTLNAPSSCIVVKCPRHLTLIITMRSERHRRQSLEGKDASWAPSSSSLAFGSLFDAADTKTESDRYTTDLTIKGLFFGPLGAVSLISHWRIRSATTAYRIVSEVNNCGRKEVLSNSAFGRDEQISAAIVFRLPGASACVSDFINAMMCGLWCVVE